MSNSYIGSENNLQTSVTTIRKNFTTSTPDQVTGSEAAYLLDGRLSQRYRSESFAYNQLLFQLSRELYSGSFAAIGHNLSKSAVFRLAKTDRFNEVFRPVWIADGNSDLASTTVNIPQTANISLLARLFIPSSSIDNESNDVPLIELFTSTGSRIVIYWSNGGSANPFKVSLSYGVGGSETASIVPGAGSFEDFDCRGFEYDLAVTYDDSTQIVSFYIDDILIGSDVSSSSWVDEGLQSIRLTSDTSNFTRAAFRAISIYNFAMTSPQVTSYEHKILTGHEKNLIWGVNFTENTSPVVDVKGNANLTLTGGTWEDRLNSKSCILNSGILEAICQPYSFNGLSFSNDCNISIGSLGSHSRNMTLACIIKVDPGDQIVTNHFLVHTSLNQIRIALINSNNSIFIRAVSTRSTTAIVTTNFDIRDGRERIVVARVEANNDSQSTLTLHVKEKGSDSYQLIGSATCGPFTENSYGLNIGQASSTTDGVISRVRLYNDYRELDEINICGPDDLSDPELIESLSLDGSIISRVDPTRVYTQNNISYKRLDNVEFDRPTKGRKGVEFPVMSREDSKIDNDIIYLNENSEINEDLLISQIGLEIWDPENPTEQIEISGARDWSSVRFKRPTGAEIGWRRIPIERTVDAFGFPKDDFEALCGSMKLEYNDNETDVDELIRRLYRIQSTSLVLMVKDTQRILRSTSGLSVVYLPQYLNLERCIIGYMEIKKKVKESSDRLSTFEVEVEGIGKGDR